VYCADVEPRAAITGIGYAAPARQVSTREVEGRIAEASGRLPFPAGTLEQVTGIGCRFMAGDGELPSTLAVVAGSKALRDAGVAADAVDLLIFASASQDQIEPATAHIVADGLGLQAPVLDVKNGCNSFIDAVAVAEAFIGTHRAQTVLVVSGETPTLAARWRIRSMRELHRSFIGFTMGDLGTAAVVQPSANGQGVFYRDRWADSRHWRLVELPGGGARHPEADKEYRFLEGDGSALRDAFLQLDPDIVLRVFRETDTTWDDYAAVCAHQPTVPFIEDIVDRLGVPPEKLVRTVDRFGNVASGSLPLALALARADGRVRSGDRVLWFGLAAGLSVSTMAFVL